MTLKDKIRTIPDYPKKGIMFRDVTTLLKDPDGFKEVVNLFVDRYKTRQVDYVVGIEARGFILGAAISYALGKGFVPIRKKGKLPGKTISQAYTLEYGTDEMEIHDDAIEKGSNCLLIDDLLATGGTALGAVTLLNKLGANVIEAAFIIDLPALEGSKKLLADKIPVHCLMEFEGD